MDIKMMIYAQRAYVVDFALEHVTPHFLTDLDVTISPQCYEEYELADTIPILPQKSIVLVHGNALSGYVNLERVLQLQPIRPDLSFIVSYDRFALGITPSDLVEKISEYRNRGMHAQYPINLTSKDLMEFVEGNTRTRKIYDNSLEPDPNSLEHFLREWKELNQPTP